MTETTNVVRLKPVESSNVKEIGYDNELGLLVRFRAGKLYRFAKFPAEQFGEFAQADSFGGYFAREVKPFYEGTVIEETVDEPVTFGAIAFQAYTEARAGRAVNGDTIPEWSDLDPAIRAAWEVAANATLHVFEQQQRE